MASIAGRKAKVYVSTDGGTTFVQMIGIDSVSGGPAAAPILDNEFGVEWDQNITGILSNDTSLSGGFRSTDSTGQIALRDAMIAGTTVWFKVLFDGSTIGWKQEVVVSKFMVDTKVSDKSNLSVELKGTGAVTFI